MLIFSASVANFLGADCVETGAVRGVGRVAQPVWTEEAKSERATIVEAFCRCSIWPENDLFNIVLQGNCT
ncbi:hypothetical protein E2562_000289 [Oryza meyeriana var. granulata]|uniref:Uncharacterized protein n=1 Tax=Oryza meyeriana var. granulata TaxID=110450 RepID=A0A6G1CLT4_9ORYZ|nr:hypothetical protein E2562_000289 [Oryza meyeriana var. granulata]